MDLLRWSLHALVPGLGADTPRARQRLSSSMNFETPNFLQSRVVLGYEVSACILGCLSGNKFDRVHRLWDGDERLYLFWSDTMKGEFDAWSYRLATRWRLQCGEICGWVAPVCEHLQRERWPCCAFSALMNMRIATIILHNYTRSQPQNLRKKRLGATQCAASWISRM